MAKKKKAKDAQKMTKYERARIVGSRALQISMGAPFLVKMSKKELEAIHYNPIDIAKKELEADVIPMTVIRPLPRREGEDAE